MKLWPHGDSKIPGLRAAMIDQAPAPFAKYGLLTQMAITNFMGEITEECGAGMEKLRLRAHIRGMGDIPLAIVSDLIFVACILAAYFLDYLMLRIPGRKR